MDQNNNPSPNLSDENTDLAKQYQDILDRYSQELAQTPAPTEETNPSASENQATTTAAEGTESLVVQQPQDTLLQSSEPVSENVTNITPDLQDNLTPVSEPAEVDSTVMEVPPQTLAQIPESQPTLTEPVVSESVSETVASAPQPETEPITTPPVFTPPEPPPAPTPIIEPPPETLSTVVPPKKNLFKITFVITLIIFLGVAAALAYALLNPPATGTTPTPSPTGTSDITQPTDGAKSCDVNGNLYQVNETFPANDGCNTCTCSEDLTISCTEKACDASSSSKLTPTSNATSSASSKTLPSDLITIIKENAVKGSTVKITVDDVKIGDFTLIGNYAKVAVSTCISKDDCPGGVNWATKVGTTWKIVAEGQEPPKCSVLAKYKFPAEFECLK